MSSITAVVVTYLPDQQVLNDLLASLIPQVEKVIIVNNKDPGVTTSNWAFEGFPLNVELIQLENNVGIALAQNRGIELAIESGASHILLLDQDSIPNAIMVNELMMALLVGEKESAASRIAAVGPVTKDSRTGKVSSFVRSRTRYAKNSPGEQKLVEAEIVDAMFLISSGMLIKSEVFSDVSAFRSEYFIDHVDTEWCFRARAKGYRLLGANRAQLNHRMGDEVIKIRILRQHYVSTHTPLRDYYMARNTLAMIKGGNIPIGWCIFFLWRIFQFCGFYLLLSKNKKQHLMMMCLGLFHGIRGVNGKLNAETLRAAPIGRSNLDPVV